jgi:hypothetical protein
MGSVSVAPLFIGFFLVVVTFASCYCISTLLIDPPLEFFLPTISELGNTPPASSIFSLGFSLASFCFAWTVFARFKDVHHVLPIERYRNVNRVACGCGLIFW